MWPSTMLVTSKFMIVGLVNDDDTRCVKKMKKNDMKSINSPYNCYRCVPMRKVITRHTDSRA